MTTAGVVRVANKFPGGAGLQKELQGFASFVSFQNACFRNGTAMTKITQEKVLSERFFGIPDDPDSVGISQQLVEGTGLFEHMYDTEEIMQQTGSQQTGNTRNNKTLVLKPFLHCLSGTSILVGNQSNQINLGLLHSSGLSSQKSMPIKGRSLLSRAQEHVKNGKKALAVVMNKRSPYKSYVATGNLPSGMSMDDYYVYVRKRMYVSLVTNATKTQLEGTLLSASQNIETTIPASVQCCDNATDDSFDDTGSFVSCHTSVVDSVVDNVGSDEQHNEDLPDHDPMYDIDDGGDLMPIDWSFPGFISFALLGPIVPSVMIPYRSELLMASLPSGNNTANNGRAALRQKARSIKQKNNKEATSTSISSSVTSGHRSETAAVALPTISQEPSLQQKIMLAGIAQSKMLIEQRHLFKMNDRVISLHQKKVSAKRMMIDELKFMISNTPANDPERMVLMHDLKQLNKALNEAVENLIRAEEEIVNGDMLVAGKTEDANTFIDLTIGMVLGTKKDANATNNFATPQSSNRKKRRILQESEAAASATSCTTSSSLAEQSLGFALPTWPCTANMSPDSPCGSIRGDNKTGSTAIPDKDDDNGDSNMNL